MRGTSLAATYEYFDAVKSEYTYYLQNAHGDVVNLTDSSGAVVKTYKYDAFGVEKNISDSDENAFRYCGEYYDKETGTVYLRARYYNPTTGRFTQRDSFAGRRDDPLSLNLYAYCRNNPILYFDPSGYSYGTLPDGTKMSINSAWDAKYFYEQRDRQLVGDPFKYFASGSSRYSIAALVSAQKNVLRSDIKANGINVMIESSVWGVNGARSKKIDFKGNDLAVYLGVHTAIAGPFQHTSVVIFAVEGSKYYDNPDFIPIEGQYGVKYATLGAGSVKGNLVSDINRSKDINLAIKEQVKQPRCL